MAPGFFFAMLVIVSFTFFIIDWIALFNPFSFSDWNFVFSTFLALDFFGLNDLGNRY